MREIELLLKNLNETIHLKNPEGIRTYLLRFTDVIDVIPQVVAVARRHFPESQLVLDVYQDPEIEDRYLVLYVRLKQYDESMFKQLENAEAEFLDQLIHKEGWIQLTTDFQEPEGEDVL